MMDPKYSSGIITFYGGSYGIVNMIAESDFLAALDLVDGFGRIQFCGALGVVDRNTLIKNTMI